MDRPLPQAALTLTAAAGVIHLLAAGPHLEESLLLGVAFLLSGVVQVAALLTARRHPALTTEVVLFVDAAAVGAWVVSRTVGLPFGLGVEAVGLADVTTVALELAAIGVILLPGRLQMRLATTTAPLAVALGLGAVALAGPATSHEHDEGHAHAETARVDTALVVQLGPGDFDGDTDLTQPANAAAMRAAMTGATQPLIVTSDGRVLGAPDEHSHEAMEQLIAARDARAAGGGDDDHTHAPGTPDHDD